MEIRVEIKLQVRHLRKKLRDFNTPVPHARCVQIANSKASSHLPYLPLRTCTYEYYIHVHMNSTCVYMYVSAHAHVSFSEQLPIWQGESSLHWSPSLPRDQWWALVPAIVLIVFKYTIFKLDCSAWKLSKTSVSGLKARRFFPIEKHMNRSPLVNNLP